MKETGNAQTNGPRPSPPPGPNLLRHLDIQVQVLCRGACDASSSCDDEFSQGDDDCRC